MKPHNPPAFPVHAVKSITELHDRSIERDNEGQRGMTLRDYFAAKAMQALIEGGGCQMGGKTTEQATAQCSYEFADAMLEEREK